MTHQKKKIKILTNHSGQLESPTWKDLTTYVPYQGNTFISSVKVALKIFRQRQRHDCIVLGAGRSNVFFAIFQTLIPFGRKPCLMIDCLWYRSPTKLKDMLDTIKMKLVDPSIDRYVVWASREIEEYSEEFHLPKEKFIFIPYHTTLNNYCLKSEDRGYIFSGGNFARDYKTLIYAVSDLRCKLLIACTRNELFKDIVIPNNVEINGFSHEEYLEKMAGCKMNIVALAPGLLHSGGQQTFLNSMYLSKPTIVTDPEGARDYINDGIDGLLVEPGNPEALRNAIKYILDNPERASKMGEQARLKAQKYTTEDHFQKIVSLAEEVTRGKARY